MSRGPITDSACFGWMASKHDSRHDDDLGSVADIYMNCPLAKDRYSQPNSGGRHVV
jgi:hypothetical protein